MATANASAAARPAVDALRRKVRALKTLPFTKCFRLRNGTDRVPSVRAISDASRASLHISRGLTVDHPAKLAQAPRASNVRVGAVRVVARAIAAPEAPAVTKRVFTFGDGQADGDASMKTLLGGKGANLAEMNRIGLSVPAGFTVTTETCAAFHENGGELPAGCWDEMLEGLAFVEKCMGKKLGDASNPLLLSVRSGAAVSMPGMMDTVLNLGLNDDVAEGLAAKAGEKFAFDSYRRFLDMYGDVVMGIEHHLFEHQIDSLKKEVGVAQDNELTAEHLRELVTRYKKVYEAEGKMFPQEPLEQMRLAANAVFDSWNSDRAKKYMAINQITGLKGTAVNIQAMVFGNMGETSGTGVCFTRNPSTGENLLYGEYLVNAQGEDVVAGIRTPEDILTMKTLCRTRTKTSCATRSCWRSTIRTCRTSSSPCRRVSCTCSRREAGSAPARRGEDSSTSSTKVSSNPTRRSRSSSPPMWISCCTRSSRTRARTPRTSSAWVSRPRPARLSDIVFDTETAEDLHAQGKKCILVRVETSPRTSAG